MTTDGVPSKIMTKVPKPPKPPGEPRLRPNRIFELTKARGMTYADVAERVREIATQRNDKTRLKVHEVTINRLASGDMKLTQEWMEMLGEVYAVPATDIIARPIGQNIIRVPVTFYLEAGAFKTTHEWPEPERYDIMIPEDVQLFRKSRLYAGELKGPSTNAKYPEKSVVILSRLTYQPGEIEVGRRYHVRVIRPSGETEETIKCLCIDDAGKYWLKPESRHPEHQAWLALDGHDGNKVELIGRVRGVYTRED
jgi:hypothetical protein